MVWRLRSVEQGLGAESGISATFLRRKTNPHTIYCKSAMENDKDFSRKPCRDNGSFLENTTSIIYFKLWTKLISQKFIVLMMFYAYFTFNPVYAKSIDEKFSQNSQKSDFDGKLAFHHSTKYRKIR